MDENRGFLEVNLKQMKELVENMAEDTILIIAMPEE